MPEYPTGIGTSDADSISLLGHDLAGELLGNVSFGLSRVAGRIPTK
jgi:citrate synthase